MIPTLSITTITSQWLARMRTPDNPLVDYERGGVGVGDTSEGLGGYDWTAYFNPDTSGVYLYREDLGAESGTLLVNVPGLVRIALAFDQNMRPVLAWRDGGGTYLWRYRASIPGYEAMLIPGALTPCVTLDERRPEGLGNSDVILSYIKDDSHLYCRVQRETYTVERKLTEEPVPNPHLLACGMTKQCRLQWRLDP